MLSLLGGLDGEDEAAAHQAAITVVAGLDDEGDDEGSGEQRLFVSNHRLDGTASTDGRRRCVIELASPPAVPPRAVRRRSYAGGGARRGGGGGNLAHEIDVIDEAGVLDEEAMTTQHEADEISGEISGAPALLRAKLLRQSSASAGIGAPSLRVLGGWEREPAEAFALTTSPPLPHPLKPPPYPPPLSHPYPATHPYPPLLPTPTHE